MNSLGIDSSVKKIIDEKIFNKEKRWINFKYNFK
jgi:hypothetical protein